MNYSTRELYVSAVKKSKDVLKNIQSAKNIINFYDIKAWVQ